MMRRVGLHLSFFFFFSPFILYKLFLFSFSSCDFFLALRVSAHVLCHCFEIERLERMALKDVLR